MVCIVCAGSVPPNPLVPDLCIRCLKGYWNPDTITDKALLAKMIITAELRGTWWYDTVYKLHDQMTHLTNLEGMEEDGTAFLFEPRE